MFNDSVNEKAGSTQANTDIVNNSAATGGYTIDTPSISLPNGGGAIQSIDEKFEVNPSNGTGSCSIPLPISPGRGGFTPQLGLSYNSGSGNGVFGLGWSIGHPMIQRRTDKELPKYMDGTSEEDVFILLGMDDLVPTLKEKNPGQWEVDEKLEGDIMIRRYRPRIEREFSRIEKIHHPERGYYWKVTTKDNVVTFFGYSRNTQIFDPQNPKRIFSWLPEFSYDDRGNWIRYVYKEENLDNVPNTLHESHRILGLAAFTNKYLKRILYANRVPYSIDPSKPYEINEIIDDTHCFELVFDYGEHHATIPQPNKVPEQQWDYRPDAFSFFRAGFEIRTNRRCKRVLMFHHFPDEMQRNGLAFGANYLVRSLDFEYQSSSINASEENEVTYLRSINEVGYIRNDDGTYDIMKKPSFSF